MSKRKQRPHHHEDSLRYRDDHLHEWNRPIRLHPRPADLEEDIAAVVREKRRIGAENQTIIDDNMALQAELTRAKDKMDRLGEMIPQLQAEKETCIRELIQTELKLEAELRSREPVKSEVRRLRAEVDELNASLQDLSSRANSLPLEITKAKVENKEVALMKEDVEMLRKQIIEARKMLEYEKRVREEQVEEKRLTEDNLVRMHREIEKLKGEKKDGGSTEARYEIGGYETMDRSPETRHLGRYGDSYSSTWKSNDSHGRRS